MCCLFQLTFSNLWRTTSEEKRALDRSCAETYKEARLAAEAHRQVQLYHLFSFLINQSCCQNIV